MFFFKNKSYENNKGQLRSSINLEIFQKGVLKYAANLQENIHAEVWFQ